GDTPVKVQSNSPRRSRRSGHDLIADAGNAPVPVHAPAVLLPDHFTKIFLIVREWAPFVLLGTHSGHVDGGAAGFAVYRTAVTKRSFDREPCVDRRHQTLRVRFSSTSIQADAPTRTHSGVARDPQRRHRRPSTGTCG